MKDYYNILGVEKDATTIEIKKAYRFLASKFHPDKHSGDTFFSERFIEIKEAFDILSDPSTKARYDNSFSSNNKEEFDKLREELKRKKEEFEKKEKDLKNKEQQFSNWEFKVQQKERELNEKAEKLREKENNDRIAWEREKEKKESLRKQKLKEEKEAKRRNIIFQKDGIIINEEFMDINGSIIPFKKCNEAVLYFINQKKKRRLGYLILFLSALLFVFFPLLLIGIPVGFYYAFYRDTYLLKVVKGYNSILVLKTKREFLANDLKIKLNRLIYDEKSP
jgi:curved DNA-binding protein CbpA